MGPIDDYVTPADDRAQKKRARLVRNRLSAQAHRNLKKDYIASLENDLEAALVRIAELEGALLQDQDARVARAEQRPSRAHMNNVDLPVRRQGLLLSAAT